MTPASPRLSAAERAEMRYDFADVPPDERSSLACRIVALCDDLADREADTTRLAEEIAELRAERDRLAAALADDGRAWCAGRDAAVAVADQRWLETEAIRSMRGITMGDVGTAMERGRAYSTVAAPIRALTPPTATLIRPCAHPCQWMPNADPAGGPRICAHCGREEPGPGATRATDGMEDGDG